MREKQLEKIIRQDVIGSPDPQVINRLNYAFMIKSVQCKPRQNSFSGFLGWTFSLKGFGLKTAVATVLLAFVMIGPKLNTSSDAQLLIDSTYVQQSFVLDSTLFKQDSQSRIDSIF